MDRQNHWNMIIELGQNTAEMRVPGVAMDNVRVYSRSVEVRTTTDRSEYRIQILGRAKRCRVDSETLHLQMWLFHVLVTETAYFDVHYLCQFAAQIIDVDSCAPINVRGVFVRQKEGFHTGI